MKMQKVNLNKNFLATLVLAGMFFVFSFSFASATTYFVSPNGNDANPGTEAKPFKTLQKGADVVNAGDTVIVEDGVYTASGDRVLRITKGGTASRYITFKSRNPHKAIIDARFINPFSVSIYNEASYIRLEEFTIRKAKDTGIIVSGNYETRTAPRHVLIINNIIQYNGNIVTTSTYGHSGIYTSPLSESITLEGNIFHNNGRLSEESAKALTNAGLDPGHAYRHDHGAYMQGQNHIINNNLFYHHTAGWAIKVDGYYGSEIPDNERTHTIINNQFIDPVTKSGGHIRFYKNSGANETAKPPKNVLIENNLFCRPENEKYKGAVSITDSSSSNFEGTIMRNNKTTAAFMYPDDANIAKNITDINNKINASESEVCSLNINNPLPGDFNGDDAVNDLDYEIMKTEFLKTGTNLKSDMNKDNKVNDLDYELFRREFGKKK